MKTCVSLALLALLAGTAQAQKLGPSQVIKVPSSEVPAVVKATFASRFPTIKEYSWMEGNGYFEAVFSMSDWRQSARFKYNGQLTETESEGSSSNFPAPVNFTLERAYKGHKVKYAATVVSADNTRTYKAVLLSGAKKQEVLLNADGTLVKQ